MALCVEHYYSTENPVSGELQILRMCYCGFCGSAAPWVCVYLYIYIYIYKSVCVEL